VRWWDLGVGAPAQPPTASTVSGQGGVGLPVAVAAVGLVGLG
jgi:hypothetical protein